MNAEGCVSMRKYVCTIGDGRSTVFPLTHGLDTWAPITTLYDREGRLRLATVLVLDPNTVSIEPSITLGSRPRYWKIGRWKIRRPGQEFYAIAPRPPAPDELVVVICG